MRKAKSAKRNFLAAKRRLTPRAGLALVGLVICLASAGYLAAKQTHPASAAGLTLITCNYGTKNGQSCLNRYRGETGEAAVVGYSADFDTNENFQFQQLSHMCSGGYVSSTCPFTVGTGLNNRYLNDMVVQIKDLSTGKCLGNYSFDGTEGAEEKCSDAYGNSGAAGTIFIWNVTGGGGTRGYTESRYWSNQYRQPAWLCYPGYPTDARTVYLNSRADFGGACQWKYLSK